MNKSSFPNNLTGLQNQEQMLREKALKMLQGRPKLSLHLDAVERAMSLAKVVVDYPADDQDFKVIKMLSIRMFNAFGASLNLLLSGYHQKSAMVMRDVLETMFLMDLFRTDRAAIERWRLADDKQKKKDFSAYAVRVALDERDGVETKKRAEAYKMLSELAAHPTMGTQYMLKPELDGDILMGPFMGATILRQGFEELGRLAVQGGEIMDAFLPEEYDPDSVRKSLRYIQNKWMETFYRKRA